MKDKDNDFEVKILKNGMIEYYNVFFGIRERISIEDLNPNVFYTFTKKDKRRVLNYLRGKDRC